MDARDQTKVIFNPAMLHLHQIIAHEADLLKKMAGMQQAKKLTRLAAATANADVKPLLPTKAKSIETLEIDDTSLASKKRKRDKLKFNLQEKGRPHPEAIPDIPRDKKYFIKKKRTEMDDGAVELEAYCGGLCKFLAGSHYVSAPRPYYGDQTYFALASPYLPTFKPNAEAPLTMIDLVLQTMHPSHLRSNIYVSCEDLLESLRSKINESTIAGLKRIFTSFFSQHQPMTINLFTEKLDAYLQSDYPFDQDTLLALRQLMIERAHYVHSHHPDIPDEFEMLASIQQHINNYLAINLNQRHDMITIQQMERAEQIVRQQRVNLENSRIIQIELPEGEVAIPASDIIKYRRIRGHSMTSTARYIKKEDDNNNTQFSREGEIVDFGMTMFNIGYELTNPNIFTLLFRKPQDTTFRCTPRDLKYLPVLRDAHPYFWPTKQTSISHLFEAALRQYLIRFSLMDTDDVTTRNITGIVDSIIKAFMGSYQQHASLISRISLGTYHILSRIKALVLRKDFEKMLAEEQRLEAFAIVGGVINEYINTHAQEVDNLRTELDQHETAFNAWRGHANTHFSHEDNRVHRSLSTHPVFEFHKFKTLLKYILPGSDFYHAFAHLYIAPSRELLRDGTPNLIDMITADEAARINEIKTNLTSMKEFRNFLSQHGDFIFSEIMREFSGYRDYCATKSGNKAATYQRVMQALDLEKITRTYHDLLAACGLEQRNMPDLGY